MVSFIDFHLQFHTNFSNSLISHELKSLSKMDKFVKCMLVKPNENLDENHIVSKPHVVFRLFRKRGLRSAESKKKLKKEIKRKIEIKEFKSQLKE